MQDNPFEQQMCAFERWKSGLAQVVRNYHRWLEVNERSSSEIDLRLFDVIESLKSDTISIAFVAEFSRGKTELINAIFFAGYKRRLLPSEVGRTTMCPTELLYDHETDMAYIKLLPIETRLEDRSISELKKTTDCWHTIALDVDSPDQMVNALKEVVKKKDVSVEEAIALGLHDEEASPRRRAEKKASDDLIEVPMWRHAIISFPHPLLKQGLSIFDTPGLNALGTEPELTLNMLPNAHAVLFVLAADTGVTRSDLDVWEYHIQQSRQAPDQKHGLMAVLNKIDMLWDEMKTNEEIDFSITVQRLEVAEALGIEPSQVFPLSAQKALVAKSKDHDELLQRTRIGELEKHLAETVIPAKQRIVLTRVSNEVGSLIKRDRTAIASQLDQVREQLEELMSLSGKNTSLVQHMMRKAREKRSAYNESMSYFESSRRALNAHARLLMNELSLTKFDDVMANSRNSMSGSWTTSGLKAGMKTLIDGLRETFRSATVYADETHRQIIKIYTKFHKENELEAIYPKPFSTDKYRQEMEQLYSHAEEYRTSPMTTLTEQHFVIKKFFISLVSRARDIYFRANQEAERWFKDIMVPLSHHVNEHKKLLEHHMEALYKINESKDNLAGRVKELESQSAHLEKQHKILTQMYKCLQDPTQRAERESNKKHAASG